MPREEGHEVLGEYTDSVQEYSSVNVPICRPVPRQSCRDVQNRILNWFPQTEMLQQTKRVLLSGFK